jgi:hypothetical protein
MSATVPRRVSLSRRLLLTVFLAVAASIVLVPGASAGNFDEEKMGCTGESPATCPTGTVGQPYSMTIYLMPPDGGRGEDFGCATFPDLGTLPPGLSISDEGFISGTPTEAGNFRFYLEVKYDKEPGCAKVPSDDEFIIKINPGVPPKPKLTIGPETTSPGTVGAPYSLPMTANLPDAKTWSISVGALPPGLTLGASDGMISGTPTTAGTYAFTVLAVIDASTSDTKALALIVREPLAVAASEPFESDTGIARTEVGVRFNSALIPSGGLAPYTMTLGGVLPDGLDLDLATGVLSGRPELAGTYRFILAVSDAEGRSDTYSGRITVAPRLAIVTKRLKAGKVGRIYRAKLKSVGGVHEVDGVSTSRSWRIKRGPLPRGIRFDRTTGSFVGIPLKRGIWVIAVEIVDALRVKATTNVVLVVVPKPKPKR